jgi:Ca2+-binding EF-hand superfamily protein
MNRKTTITAALLLATCAGFAVPSFAQETAPAPEAAMPGDMGPMGMMPDFATLDTNGDGKLTVEDITAKRAARAAALDANKDGLISADELVAQRMQDIQTRVEAGAKAEVAALDLDGDGQLSAAELAAGPGMGMGKGRGMAGGHRDGAMTGAGPMAGPERMIARFDTDKDGAVSEAEFDAGKLQMVNMMQEHRKDRMQRGDEDGQHMRGDRGHGRGERGHGDKRDGHRPHMKPPVDAADAPSDAAPSGN